MVVGAESTVRGCVFMCGWKEVLATPSASGVSGRPVNGDANFELS